MKLVLHIRVDLFSATDLSRSMNPDKIQKHVLRFYIHYSSSDCGLESLSHSAACGFLLFCLEICYWILDDDEDDTDTGDMHQ